MLLVLIYLPLLIVNPHSYEEVLLATPVSSIQRLHY